MSVTVIGLPQFKKRLQAVGHGRPILRDLQIRAVREAKLRVARKTGYTARTIMPGEVTDRYAIIRAAGAAPYLEFGTKPHEIRPRTRRALAWPAAAAGRRLSGRARTATRAGGLGGMAFAARVQHPGTKAQPFLIPGAEEAVRQVGVQAIVDTWNRAA